MYRLETGLLIGAWVAGIVSILFIPRKRACEAFFIFNLTQFFTWILGLVTVEFGWLAYPVHEMSRANSTSFLFEYFLMPLLAAHFILRYPSAKALTFRIIYCILFIAVFTLVEVIVERYTLIIDYHSWKWYWTSISMSLVLYFIMVIYKWFFRIPRPFLL